MNRIGKWLILAGLLLGLLDMALITFMPRKPLPKGVGFLLPIGIGLGYITALLKKRRRDACAQIPA